MAFKCMTCQSTSSILSPYIHPPFQLFQIPPLQNNSFKSVNRQEKKQQE